MGTQTITANDITAIVFDAVPQPLPIKRSWFRAAAKTQQTSPVYRSLNDAMAEIARRGVPDDSVRRIRDGLEFLMITAVADLERKSDGAFNRRRNVQWEVGSAYLGLRFVEPDIACLATEKPELVANIRAQFHREVNEFITRFASTFHLGESPTAAGGRLINPFPA